ncbi:MAG TPA: methyltransferase domain-containing protein [Aeromicrobium sp.]|nr:methyltransferase domain-containing protein [Aeromicrobium sp.]
MGAGSNAEWIRWGEVDPFWGVASWEGKDAESDQAWSEEEFFEFGRRDWADFHDRWARYGLAHGSCLEIGSGTGRMTRAMAADFAHVHGVDVAPGMLAHAARAVANLPVTLHQGDGLTLPLPDGSVDAAFSTHVFQHLDSTDDANANWREIFRVLKPGGTFMVHLPVHYWPGGMERLQSLYEMRRRIGDMRAAMRRRKMDKGGTPIMRGQFYEWNTLDATLTEMGFRDVELTIIRVSSNNGQHSCVMGRKA